MSDCDCEFDCDCDPDCGDLDCCDIECCPENCCSCDSGGCWHFWCFRGGGDTWDYYDDSPKSRHSPKSRSSGSGSRYFTQPPHQSVKAGLKPKKRSRFKRIFLFWKTNKKNDQEQKPAEEQLDHMPSWPTYPDGFGPPRGYHHHEFGHPANFSYRTEHM